MFGRRFKKVAEYKYPASLFSDGTSSTDAILALAIQCAKEAEHKIEKTPHKYSASLSRDKQFVTVTKSVAV